MSRWEPRRIAEEGIYGGFLVRRLGEDVGKSSSTGELEIKEKPVWIVGRVNCDFRSSDRGAWRDLGCPNRSHCVRLTTGLDEHSSDNNNKLPTIWA